MGIEFLELYQKEVQKALENFFYDYQPEVLSLYEPVKYALEGGKKLRPVFVLLATDILGGNYKQAIPAALAVEMFHNFTLVHDDVMDKSPLRRGKPTVYHKWDVNQAILSGDAMLLLVYQILSNLEEKFIKGALKILTWAGLRVSEGQQLDMEFENKPIVSLSQYLKMIELKTSVLIGTAFKLGAFIANAPEQDQNAIYNFGVKLGLAFQIQDDYLDLYGETEKFGKQIGNDIITKKKTFLFVKAYSIASKQDKLKLLEIYNSDNIPPQEKIAKVSEIYNKYNLKQLTLEQIENYYQDAQNQLNHISKLTSNGKQKLMAILDYLMQREK